MVLTTNIHLLIVLLFLALYALTNGAQIAIAQGVKQPLPAANFWGISAIYRAPRTFLMAMLVGNALFFAGYFITAATLSGKLLGQLLPSGWFLWLLQVAIPALIIIFVVELGTQMLFRLTPNTVFYKLRWPLWLIYVVLWVFAWPLAWASRKWLNYPGDEEHANQVLSRADLYHALKIKGLIDSNETDDLTMVEKALDLPYIKVRECMIPRTEIYGVNITDTIDVVKRELTESRHSKLIVYKENIDNIVGYIHHQDVLQLHQKNNQNWQDRLWRVVTVPQSYPASELLATLIREHRSIAWVIDEFGGTAGIATLEDIIEEVIGEISDEYDVQEHDEAKIAPDKYQFSGRLEIDYINEKYGLDLPIGEYETLAGWIMTKIERIPQNNEEINLDPFLLKIIEADEKRINSLLLQVIKKTDNGNDIPQNEHQ
ncbi:MAG: hemolysin family protein [Bacteroidetes bacterium]|nr:hemolysin family protein [Bacteroidota bacterium]